ncbi:MAG: GGDEF domain-containing protein [bacterium]|nr:GGDEF domain-containing protein [bacterium]
MKKKQTVHMLDSLIEMTQYRDRELIAGSLVNTLYELLAAKKIELYAVHKAEKPVVLNLLARIDSYGLSSIPDTPAKEFEEKPSRAIIRCIRNREIVILKQPDNEMQVIFPILDKKEEVVSLVINHCSKNSSENQRLTEGVLRLYHNYLSLLEDSQRDRLTGLLNRETFINALNKVIEKHRKRKDEKAYPHSTRQEYKEKDYTHWLGLLDIDHFKRINDNYGHLYGDEILIMVVRMMQSTFRKEDLLFRYGGEEFIVVLRVPNKESAVIAFERFRKRLESYQFPQVGKVTVSIGYVQIKDDDFPLTIVGKADKALYYAKEHGRNCLFNYEELVEQGELAGEEEDLEHEEGVEFF